MIAANLRAEDADRFRPYLHVSRGEFNYQWGLDDMWGLGGGVNLNRYFGVEVALDTWDDKLSDPVLGTVGEIGVGSFTTQLRLRYPVAHDRVVPYAIAGVGGALYQFNDRKPAGFNQTVNADSSGFVATAGAGLDFYVIDNVALNLEFKYLAFDPVEMSVDGRRQEFDASNWAATLGLRVFFDENRPRPMAETDPDIPTRLYFGMRLGGSFQTDSDWAPGMKFDPEPAAWGGTFSQHEGLMIGANFGRAWGVELAADGGEYIMVDDALGGISEYAFASVMPQVRFRWPWAEGRWVPYLMGGVGICYGEDNDVKAASEGHSIDAKGIYPAVAAGGGVEHFLTRKVSVSAEARWFYTWGHEFELDGRQDSGDFSNLQVLLGMRLYFLEF